MEKATCSSVFLVLVLLSGSYGIPQRDTTLLDTPDECKDIMDIAILADISQSMNDSHRDELIKIVNDLVDKLTVSEAGNHFGLITFGDGVTLHNTFADKDYQIAQNFKDSVATALKVIPEKEGTRTDLAEHLAATTLFNETRGNRPNAINVMLILTDGKPFMKDGDIYKLGISFSELTRKLEKKGVSIKVVGIGEHAAANVDDMRKTAGTKGKVVLHNDFAELSNKLYKQFKESFCSPEDGSYTNWFPASNCSVTCGVGVRTFRRTCTNPPPSNGGHDCTGPAEKTVSCNEGKCSSKCKNIMDIAILADKSLSMNEFERDQLTKIVHDLVDKLTVSEAGNHFSLITFGGSATLHNTFANKDYQIAQNLKDSVTEELNFSSKINGTRTDLAQNLSLTLFTEEGGDRPNAINVMLILTDGKPYVAKWQDNAKEIAFDVLTTELEKKNVSIMVVGVGEDAKKNEADMHKTAGKKGKVIIHDNFTELSNELYKQFKEFFCSPPEDPPVDATCLTDVAFIVDSSGSIHGTNFYDAKEVVKNLVMTLDLASSKDRAALVLFSSSASLVARFGQYGTVNRFLDFVQKLPKIGGRTRIDRALNRTVNEVFPDARQEAYKIAIVLTDGVQSSGARGLKPTSKPLRDAGIRLLAVGVGTGLKEDRLRLMTDRQEDVVNVKNIQARFKKILDELSQNACTPPRPTKASQEPECTDKPDYARHCQEKANEAFCWAHPDFSAVNCPVSCNLCV